MLKKAIMVAMFSLLVLVISSIICIYVCNKLTSLDIIRTVVELNCTNQLRDIARRASLENNYEIEKTRFFSNGPEKFGISDFDELVEKPDQFTYIEIDLRIINTIRRLHLKPLDDRILLTSNVFVTDDDQLASLPGEELQIKCRVVFSGEQEELNSILEKTSNLIYIKGYLLCFPICFHI